MPNVHFKLMDVHKSPIPHFHIIQTEEFISEVNGNKKIHVKGHDYDANQTKLTNNMKWAVPR